MRMILCLLVVCVLAAPAVAEPPAPMDDRVKILEVEMNRGPAKDLAVFLTEDAHPLSRWYAVRALGRIGDVGAATGMLAAFLDEGREPLAGALWAAGIAKTDKLHDAIAKHLESERSEIVAAAAEALGWTGKDGASDTISPLLTSADPVILAGALMGLARCRKEGHLERVAPFVHHADEHVRRAADFACWYLAGARKKGAQEGWDGEPALVPVFLKELDEAAPERRLSALRVLGSLLPEGMPTDGRWAKLLEDPDARVTQEAVWRVFRPRKAGPLLLRARKHEGPKVRSMALDALGDVNLGPGITTKWSAAETDARVRDDIAVLSAKWGDKGPRENIRDDARRAELETAFAQLTWARILLTDEVQFVHLFSWLTPEVVANGLVHPVVVMAVLDGVRDSENDRVTSWVRSWIGGAGPFDFDDPYVAASAVSVLGERGDFDLATEWCKAGGKRALVHGEVRAAIATAFGVLGANEHVEHGLRLRIVANLRDTMARDPSAWVQKAAHGALEKLGEDVPDANTLKPNDWRGLPRPAGPVLGVDVSKGEGDWLSAAEILRLADAIAAQQPKIVFDTTQGELTVTLDPESAPVHSVAVVLAVLNGTYDDTRWHRVVPSFVIQGGDPHGHGAGNSGYFIPDEITRISYERGVLGMPKSQKDDGGCQLFFMHSPYVPLDGRYTAYGRIVDGLGALDAIRVGDRITGAKITE